MLLNCIDALALWVSALSVLTVVVITLVQLWHCTHLVPGLETCNYSNIYSTALTYSPFFMLRPHFPYLVLKFPPISLLSDNPCVLPTAELCLPNHMGIMGYHLLGHLGAVAQRAERADCRGLPLQHGLLLLDPQDVVLYLLHLSLEELFPLESVESRCGAQ
jgi:hypothetical protein